MAHRTGAVYETVPGAAQQGLGNCWEHSEEYPLRRVSGRVCYLVRSILIMVFSLWDKWLFVLAAHIPPDAHPGSFLTLKPFVKSTCCVYLVLFWVLCIRPPGRVGEQASIPGKDLKLRKSQDSSRSHSQCMAELAPFRHLTWVASS